jgi:putative membrane protein
MKLFYADPSPLVLFVAGAVAICAMILPGLSGSFLLLMFGMYETILAVIDDRMIGDAVVFGVGAVLGLALFASLLTRLLERHHDTMLAVLIGLMIGSLRVLWPWPNGVGVIGDTADTSIPGTGLEWPPAGDLPVPLLLAAAAFAVVLAVDRLAHNRP